MMQLSGITWRPLKIAFANNVRVRTLATEAGRYHRSASNCLERETVDNNGPDLRDCGELCGGRDEMIR